MRIDLEVLNSADHIIKTSTSDSGCVSVCVRLKSSWSIERVASDFDEILIGACTKNIANHTRLRHRHLAAQAPQ